MKLQEFKVPHTDAVAVIDYQTSRAWLTAINFCRIFNQMRRQNLYALEHMKGLTLNTDDLQSIKRFFKMSIAFWVTQSTIYCIECKDNEWKYTDKKNTPANDIVINSSVFS